MRVLFFMRSTVYVRNFESTLRLLAQRGHQVCVVADPHVSVDPANLMAQLCQDDPRITHSQAPRRPVNGWSLLGAELRRALDYLRYLEPEYGDAPKLRRRARKTAPAFLLHALEWPFVDTAIGRRVLAGVLRRCDRALPRDAAVDAFVRAQNPDLVLVTPLVEPGSPQSEYIRSARALGVPVGLCVYSWDNLTNKGLIHDALDIVTVWNEQMKEEAVALHRVPADRIVVTGTAAYDHWFEWKPRLAREAFCARAGLDAHRPYILYVCSSRFIAPDEVPFVRWWVQELRGRSDLLRSVGVLVRPHPQNSGPWHDADLGDLDNVVIWPRAGANPLDEDSRADYYDSIHQSVAVVGVNTSAQIESAIVGRGVYTLLAPVFRDTQEGTLHFRHLRAANGGLLHVAADVAEHVMQLETAVRSPDAAADRSRRFVEAFVRPHGLHSGATPRLVAALETTAGRAGRRPHRGPWWAFMLRPALARAAAAVARTEREARPERSRPSKAHKKPVAAPQEEPSRVRPAGTGVPGTFEIYLRIREWALRLRVAGVPGELPVPERQMLAALQPIWDATAEAVGTLRHYGEAITGVRAADYDRDESDLRERLARDLRRLLAKGYPALRVDEPTVLGGFGVDGHGRLYNEDTLRFLRVLTLLQDAALLNDFRRAGPKGVVWEIGAGWGGFAYQFKTLCPNVTYLITAHPEQMLLSAVYLMSVFPSARFRFYEPTAPQEFWDRWDTVDFAFAPESVVAAMQPPAVDLTIDLMALERMSPSRIDMHVQRAYDLGSGHFFSICPTADQDSDLAAAVRPTLERWYWPHPVSAPSFVSWRLGLRDGASGSVERTFLLAWRRLRANDC